MTYTGHQLAAIVRMAITMASADGKFVEEEKNAISMELTNFGVDPLECASILIKSRDMEASEALATIAAMNYEQKKYVTGYLAVIMVADGEIAESEVKMWSLISLLANLPEMTLNEALDFWNTH